VGQKTGPLFTACNLKEVLIRSASNLHLNFESVPVKEILKSVNIYQRYGQKFSGTYLMAYGIVPGKVFARILLAGVKDQLEDRTERIHVR